jgi:nucleotide-binding universal stress UspA family protein
MLGAVRFLSGSGIRARGLIAEGRAGAEIVSAAVSERSELVVVGSGSNSVLAHLLGSVSTHVLAHSPCSVMVVHSLVSDLKPRRVLVATDGGSHWDEELHLLERLIDPQRTVLKTVSVAATEPPLVAVAPGAYAPLMDDHERERLRERAEHAVDLACDQLSQQGFRVSSAVASGPVALTLDDMAKEWSAAVTVVGSRGLHGAERVMLGSVGHTVARLTPATLVVRERERASIALDDDRKLESSLA